MSINLPFEFFFSPLSFLGLLRDHNNASASTKLKDCVPFGFRPFGQKKAEMTHQK